MRNAAQHAMSVPPSFRELLSRETVNLRNPREVELWTETLGIYTAELVQAVSVVGPSSAKVFEYLERRGLAGNGGLPLEPREPDPTP